MTPANTTSYPALFAEGRIGRTSLTNRIVMAAMATNYATNSGEVTPQMRAFYRERAAGGAAAVIVEYAYVDPRGRALKRQLGVEADRRIAGLSALAQDIREYDAVPGIQVVHAMGKARFAITGSQGLSPSGIALPGGDVPRELTLEEIDGVIASYVEAARRVAAAGFEILELHLGHGYGPHQFLSRIFNRRTDTFGGDVEGRCRLSCELIGRCVEAVGDQLTVTAKISGSDLVPWGADPSEMQDVARLLVAAGVQGLVVSGGSPEAQWGVVPPMYTPHGVYGPASAAIKDVVEVPVMCVGRITNPVEAERLIESGACDYVQLGRALLSDPAWPRKAAEGRAEQICPCIGCNTGCSDRLALNVAITCTTNPRVGREADGSATARERRYVTVIGGGPAGLEVARVSAQRGHRVSLYERDKELGGLLRLATRSSDKDDLGRYLDWLVAGVERAGVDLHLGCEADEQAFAANLPDVVVLATGRTFAPVVTDADGMATGTSADVFLGLTDDLPPQGAVVLGASLIGLETARYLAERGWRVTVLEESGNPAPELGATTRTMLLGKLDSHGVNILDSTIVLGIQAHSVRCSVLGLSTAIPASLTISALDGGPTMVRQPTPVGVPVVEVGDVRMRGLVYDAVQQGFQVACTL